MNNNGKNETGMTRRNFMKTSAAVGAGVALTGSFNGVRAEAAEAAKNGKVLKCAIIGAGNQGMILLRDAVKIPGVMFVAVCDIWKYSQRYASSTIKRANRRIHKLKKDQAKPRIYVDYKEMLEKETGLDAVIVATPDFMHAEHSIACLKKGINVYSEKEMSNDLKKAAAMVRTARETGKLLQVGHQRRSNPIYIGALKMIQEDKLIGRPTACYAQWNRAASALLEASKKYKIDDAVLKKYGYKNMSEFRNWRWYNAYSAGPIADLGSHQIDIFGWFLDAHAHSVLASGQKSYYKDRQWYEDVMTIYKYQAKQGEVQAFYQVVNTNSFGNYFERFMGDRGTIVISEDVNNCYFVPESGCKLPEYMKDLKVEVLHGKRGYRLVDMINAKDPELGKRVMQLQPLGGNESIHGLHLKNFFAALNGKEKLNCPADIAYHTAVEVLNVLPTIESNKKHFFKKSDFEVK